MKVAVRVTSTRGIERVADGILANVVALVTPVVADKIEDVAERARVGIRNGPKTGRIYTHRFYTDSQGRVRPLPNVSRPAHQASAPGEYPAADTGNTIRSIHAEEVADVEARVSVPGDVEIVGEAYADAEHAFALEFKPPEKGGRPFMTRALQEESDAIAQAVRDAIRGKVAR